MAPKKAGERKKKSAKTQAATHEYTIHLHKRVFGVSFKKRAPRAVKAVKKFAADAMKTKDVRIDSKLNKYLWSRGIRNVPYRVRVQCARMRSEDATAGADEFFTLVSHVPVAGFKGLQNRVVVDDE